VLFDDDAVTFIESPPLGGPLPKTLDSTDYLVAENERQLEEVAHCLAVIGRDITATDSRSLDAKQAILCTCFWKRKFLKLDLARRYQHRRLCFRHYCTSSRNGFGKTRVLDLLYA
jgi:hypothetical protein